MGRYSRDRSQMYSLQYDTPPPLVPRRMRLGVPGRMNAAGEELQALDEDAVRAAARRLVEQWQVESIAVCYLHAYRNPAHEQRTKEIIRAEWPDLAVSISSDIVREYREYERTSTTVVNANIQPVFRRYIGSLERALEQKKFSGSFYITRSGGGALLAHDAAEVPVHTIFSGPAGGLIGAARLSEVIGRSDLIAVDIGGTSTDACVLRGGTASLKYQASLERLPLMISMYDISTIGAGGGSIARVEGGLLKVGPQSAGAEPGPICYGRGGTQPTFTDAAVLLGYIDPDYFFGGELRLDAEAARRGMLRHVAEPLGLTEVEAARGVFDVLLARTVSAIREITVEQGLDPREFDMLAFGGAGPLFVPLVGREMGVREVIVPQAPSVFSAWGMLMTDLVQEYAQTFVGLLEDIGTARLHEIAADLEEEGAGRLDARRIQRCRSGHRARSRAALLRPGAHARSSAERGRRPARPVPVASTNCIAAGTGTRCPIPCSLSICGFAGSGVIRDRDCRRSPSANRRSCSRRVPSGGPSALPGGSSRTLRFTTAPCCGPGTSCRGRRSWRSRRRRWSSIRTRSPGSIVTGTSSSALVPPI